MVRNKECELNKFHILYNSASHRDRIVSVISHLPCGIGEVYPVEYEIYSTGQASSIEFQF